MAFRGTTLVDIPASIREGGISALHPVTEVHRTSVLIELRPIVPHVRSQASFGFPSAALHRPAALCMPGEFPTVPDLCVYLAMFPIFGDWSYYNHRKIICQFRLFTL